MLKAPTWIALLILAGSSALVASIRDDRAIASGKAGAVEELALLRARSKVSSLNGEIYVMNADGSHQTNVTKNPEEDDAPAWSPVADKIAFSRCVECGEIYAMNADGTGQTNLTKDPGDDVLPAWSRDGARIAFTRFGDGGSEIFVMNADGSGQRNLTDTPAMYEIGCTWSPDGAHIAFDLYVPGIREGDIYVMDADGTNRRNVSNDPRDDGNPAWSPDGQHIAFTRTTDGNTDIWLMNADGSGQKDLTADPTAGETEPAWSPDGARIAFTHFVGSPANGDIYVMRAAGGAPRRLTSSDGYDMWPTWSADGKRIAFATERYSVVPSVVGLKLGPAARRIRSRGLRVGRVRRIHSTRIGKVLTQIPRAGRRVRRLAKVALVVGRA